MARYKQLTCPEEIVQQKDDAEWSIEFHWLLTEETEPPVLIECAFAWVLLTARVGTGSRLSPLRVEFIQDRRHVKVIERHFGCPVVVRASGNVIVFRAADTTKLHRLEKNLGAAGVELTPDNLREPDAATSSINIQGARYPEELQKLAGR